MNTKDGTLKEKGGAYVFTKDHQFASASAAAGVILGASANGNIAWHNNEGITLRELSAHPLDRKSTPKPAHRQRGKPNRKYEVKAELKTPQLAKTGASLGLNIWCDGEKLGELKVGRGSLFWWGAHRKNRKRIPWGSFARLLNREAYGEQ